MLFAADGHEVTVLERDPSLPVDPAKAYEHWERSSVRQFQMGHYFLPPFRAALEAHLPQVIDGLEANGAFDYNPILRAPESLTGGVRPGDERFGVLTGSRPMVEAVVAACAAEVDGLTIRRGVAVTELITDPDRPEGAPVHVTGVVTADGERVEADLVVDASGRNSGLPRLLAAAGAEAPVDEADDSGFVYYGRAFRSPDGSVPASMGGGLQEYGSISTLTLAADNGTWAIAFVASGRDKAMRRVRDEERFEELWRSYPLVAHWLDGEPMTDIKVMGNLEDRIRHFVVDGAPVATGLAAVGDSWACTNPSVGRGASMGMLHVLALRDVLRETPLDDPVAFALAFDERTAETVEPLYRETVRGDRHRLAQIEAELAGTAYEPTDPMLRTIDALPAAGMADPELFRIWLDGFMMNTSIDELLADPDVRARVEELGATADDAVLGPDRPQLEAILAA